MEPCRGTIHLNCRSKTWQSQQDFVSLLETLLHNPNGIVRSAAVLATFNQGESQSLCSVCYSALLSTEAFLCLGGCLHLHMQMCPAGGHHSLATRPGRPIPRSRGEKPCRLAADGGRYAFLCQQPAQGLLCIQSLQARLHISGRDAWHTAEVSFHGYPPNALAPLVKEQERELSRQSRP